MTTTKTLFALLPGRRTLLFCLLLGAMLTAGAAPALAAPEPPQVTSVSAGNPSEATFHGVVNPGAKPTEAGFYQFVYRATNTGLCKGSGELKAPAEPGMFLGIFQGEEVPGESGETVKGLKAGTEYAVCLVAYNAAQTESTPSTPATTFLTTPGAETKPATEVHTSSAKLEGTLATEGGEVEYWFSYNEGPNCNGPSAKLAPASPATGKGNVSEPVSELLPGTQYSYCLIARNTGGATVGNQQSFTTEPVPPVILEQSVLSVSSTAARLTARVNPGGADTKYSFEYDTSGYPPGSPAHGQSVAGDLGEGAVPQTVEADVQGLSPATVYHFRVVLESTKGTAPGEDHTFTTQTVSGASGLIDGRGWELVSPPNKHGEVIEPLTESGGVLQASLDGGAFTYVAGGPVDEQPAGTRATNVSQLLSTRVAGGGGVSSSSWVTQDITSPNEVVGYAVAGDPAEYKFFSEDLSAGLVEPFTDTALSTLTTERTPYLAQPGRMQCPGRPPIVPEGVCYQPLVTAANVPAETRFGGEEEPEPPVHPGAVRRGVEFRTATPDLSHVLLESPQVLAGGFKPGFTSENPNLYELSGGVLSLVSVLPPSGGEPERPAAEAGLSAELGFSGDMRGAIANDGNRVVFRAGEAHLYLRDMGLGQTVQLDVPQEGAPAGGQAAEFQVAATEGATTKVFFTDEAQLTRDPATHTEGRDLYMCEVKVQAGRLACHLSDLSVDVEPGERAEVGNYVSAVGGSGRLVYFAAGGVLTSEPNSRGETAMPGNCHNHAEGEASCNMYVYDTVSRHISLVAVLSSTGEGSNQNGFNPADGPDWGEPGANNARLASLTAGSSPDGRYFVFMSDRQLTGYDNVDVNEAPSPQEVLEGVSPAVKVKHRDEEVFVYDSQTGGLSCVSCDPSGARPHGVLEPYQSVTPTLLVDNPRGWPERWLAGSIPGWTQVGGRIPALRQPRYVFDSGRVFFDAADGLVGAAGNGVEDVYEFEPEGVPSGEHACSSSTSSGSSTYKPEHAYRVEGRKGTEPAGCVGLISSGTSSEESAFLDASETGNDVFFLTSARLSPLDVDSARDVYDAHLCSTQAPCPAPASSPPVCEGDACQAVVAPPSEATPGSLTFNGPGNLAPSHPAAPKPSLCSSSLGAPAKGCTKKQNLTKALATCKRKYPHNKKRRATCEKAARKAYAAKVAAKHAARK